MTQTTANRRVGTITAGIALIASGAIFLVNILAPALLPLELVFGFWPLILVGIGVELLVFRFSPSEAAARFDWVSVILVFLLVFASFGLESYRQWMLYWQAF